MNMSKCTMSLHAQYDTDGERSIAYHCCFDAISQVSVVSMTRRFDVHVS